MVHPPPRRCPRLRIRSRCHPGIPPDVIHRPPHSSLPSKWWTTVSPTPAHLFARCALKSPMATFTTSSSTSSSASVQWRHPDGWEVRHKEPSAPRYKPFQPRGVQCPITVIRFSPNTSTIYYLNNP